MNRLCSILVLVCGASLCHAQNLTNFYAGQRITAGQKISVMPSGGGGGGDITTGIAARWKFDEGTGTSVADASGGGHPAALQNTAIWTNGPNGNYAVEFDHPGDYVLTTLTNLNYAAGSVSWWMMPLQNYNAAIIRAMWGSMTSGTADPSFTGQVYSDNNFYVGWSGASDWRVTLAASAANYPNGTWKLYTLTWSAAGSKLYLNGSQIGSNGTAPATADFSNALCIGRQGAAAPAYCLAAFDDFIVWSRELSATDIGLLFTTGAQ